MADESEEFHPQPRKNSTAFGATLGCGTGGCAIPFCLFMVCLYLGDTGGPLNWPILAMVLAPIGALVGFLICLNPNN